MFKITNTQRGLRSAYVTKEVAEKTSTREIIVQPGKSVTIDCTADELDAPEDWFKIEEVDGSAPSEQTLSSADMTTVTGASGDDDGGDLSEDDEMLLAALESLDPTNEAQWTNGGLPTVEVVSKILGRSVTRADINRVAPDLKRADDE